MVVLDADHPDIEEFVWCKADRGAQGAGVLRDAGFDMDLDGKDAFSIQYQNANNSVRVTDEFMQAVLDDADWHLVGHHRHRCGPSRRVTCSARSAKPRGSAPTPACSSTRPSTAGTRSPRAAASPPATRASPATGTVHTDKGLVRFEELFDRVRPGRDVRRLHARHHQRRRSGAPGRDAHHARRVPHHRAQPDRAAPLRQRHGAAVHAGHRIFTTNRGWVEAEEPHTRRHDPHARPRRRRRNRADLALPVPPTRRRTPTRVTTTRRWYFPGGVDRRVRALPRLGRRRRRHLECATTSTIYGSAADTRRDPCRDTKSSSPPSTAAERRSRPSRRTAPCPAATSGRRQFTRFLETCSASSPSPAQTDDAVGHRAGAAAHRRRVPPRPFRRRRLAPVAQRQEGVLRRARVDLRSCCGASSACSPPSASRAPSTRSTTAAQQVRLHAQGRLRGRLQPQRQLRPAHQLGGASSGSRRRSASSCPASVRLLSRHRRRRACVGPRRRHHHPARSSAPTSGRAHLQPVRAAQPQLRGRRHRRAQLQRVPPVDNSACNLASLNLLRSWTTTGRSTSRRSRTRSRSCSPRRRSSSATPTTRPRRSVRQPVRSGSWASATPTSARC